MGIPILFDTDAGTDIDDLYALALLLRHPNVELLGVTTVAGDTQARARLVAKMLRLAGRTDVPVFAGMRVPLAAADEGAPDDTFGSVLTHCDLVEPGDPEYGADYGDAVDFMLEALDTAEEPIRLVGTGPWTNIAALLRRANSARRSRVGSIALMGGEIRVRMSEFNVCCDPEAAAEVLAGRVPTFVGTWSVTRQLFFSMPEVESLLGAAGSPFLQALCAGTRRWWGLESQGANHKPGPVCYDAVPVFWAAGERDAISCLQAASVAVELEGRHTRGMTLVSPDALMHPQRSDAMSADWVTITDSMDADTLKRRYQDLVFPEGVWR